MARRQGFGGIGSDDMSTLQCLERRNDDVKAKLADVMNAVYPPNSIYGTKQTLMCSD